MSILYEVNHRLESRMREIRLSGSEGGGANSIGSPYPYPTLSTRILRFSEISLPGR